MPELHDYLRDALEDNRALTKPVTPAEVQNGDIVIAVVQDKVMGRIAIVFRVTEIKDGKVQCGTHQHHRWQGEDFAPPSNIEFTNEFSINLPDFSDRLRRVSLPDTLEPISEPFILRPFENINAIRQKWALLAGREKLVVSEKRLAIRIDFASGSLGTPEQIAMGERGLEEFTNAVGKIVSAYTFTTTSIDSPEGRIESGFIKGYEKMVMAALGELLARMQQETVLQITWEVLPPIEE